MGWGLPGGVGRARVSTHLYNSEEDVRHFLDVMQEIPATVAAR